MIRYLTIYLIAFLLGGCKDAYEKPKVVEKIICKGDTISIVSNYPVSVDVGTTATHGWDDTTQGVFIIEFTKPLNTKPKK